MHAARCSRRGAKDARRDAEGLAQGTRDRGHAPKSAMHGTQCAAHFAHDAPLIPPALPRDAGHRSPAPRHQCSHLRGGDVLAHRATVADPCGQPDVVIGCKGSLRLPFLGQSPQGTAANDDQ